MGQAHIRTRRTTSLNQADARVRAFRLTLLVTLVLLVLQYILGMIANLTVQYPSGNLWGWVFQNSVLIQLHIYNGTLLIVMALVALVLSIVARHLAGVITAIAGLVLLILAWLGGADFLRSQGNGFSLLMALGFIGAFVAYLVGYYLSMPHVQKQSLQASE